MRESLAGCREDRVRAGAMHVELWDLGIQAPSSAAVKLPELATHIAADWFPGHPSSVSPGLTALLEETLETANVAGLLRWTTSPAVAGFERQWRSVTSFIIGAGFCHWATARLGYPWWVPVSFYEHSQKPAAPFHWWLPAFDLRVCQIRKPSPALSKLRPDFVLLRRSSTGAFQLAFAEAKGTTRALANSVNAPYAWGQQARNAEFVHNGAVVAAQQHIVVATRIMPTNTTLRGRRVCVRVWNNSTPSEPAPHAAALEVLRLHYMGVCRQIGLPATANLLAWQALRTEGAAEAEDVDRMTYRLRFEKAFGHDAIARQTERAALETTPESVGAGPEVRVHFPRADRVRLGERRMRTGLTEPAWRVIQALIDGTLDLSQQSKELAALGPARVLGEMVIRGDGVVAVTD